MEKITPNFRISARNTEYFGLNIALEKGKHNGMKSAESVISITQSLPRNCDGLIQGLSLSKQIIWNNVLSVLPRLNSLPLDAKALKVCYPMIQIHLIDRLLL